MIVITGASQGLGFELAKLFQEKGKKVIDLSRHKPQIDGVDFIEMDLMQEESIKTAANKLLQMKDPIDALINCAGVYSEQEIEKLTWAELERIFHTNLLGAILLTSQLMTRLKKDGADIVNVASTVGTKAYKDQAAYGSSKWGMRGFSQNLQLELKDFPCRVISFCPGGFLSNLVKNFDGSDIKDPENWMSPKDLAAYMVQILELPKNMEVSEVIINRKTVK